MPVISLDVILNKMFYFLSRFSSAHRVRAILVYRFERAVSHAIKRIVI